MPTDFRSIDLSVPSDTGTKTVQGTVTFNSPVQRADTAVRSFLFDYSSTDHHINVVQASGSVERKHSALGSGLIGRAA